jgi:hypothetical protein
MEKAGHRDKQLMKPLYIIVPYRHPDTPNIWVFDDDMRGLLREPFVGEANTMLDYAAEKLKPTNRLILFLTDGKHRFYLDWLYHNILAELELKQGGDAVGSTYDVTLSDGKRFTDVWLCPTLLKYFDEPPERIATTITPYANRLKIGNKTAPARETQT